MYFLSLGVKGLRAPTTSSFMYAHSLKVVDSSCLRASSWPPGQPGCPVMCPYEKGARRHVKMASRELISIVPLVVVLSTCVILLLQLMVYFWNGKFNQLISQSTATEGAKRPFRPRSWNISSRSIGRTGVFIWIRSPEIPVAENEVSVTGLARSYAQLYKGNSGRVRSRSTRLIWTGPKASLSELCFKMCSPHQQAPRFCFPYKAYTTTFSHSIWLCVLACL